MANLLPNRANAQDSKQLLSINEFCSRIGMGRTWLYEELNAGRIKSVRLGTRRLIPSSEVDRLIYLAEVAA